jgi:hypothetical protein
MLQTSLVRVKAREPTQNHLIPGISAMAKLTFSIVHILISFTDLRCQGNVYFAG